MKKKILGILIVITILAIVPTTILAYSGINTNITIGETNAAKSSVAVTNRIVGVLQVAGTVISVIALIIIGMRYMFSSVQDKAQMKGVIGYYIAGCVLVFATSNVLAFAYDVVSDVQHSYGAMYNIVPSTCVKQGTANRACKGEGGLCNCTEGNQHIIVVNLPLDSNNHKIGSWTVTTKETCTEDGTETRKCVYGCGKTETRTRKKLNHNYINEIIKQATCTTEGYSGNKCQNCGDEKDIQIIAATGHASKYNSVITTQATCTTDGVRTYTCPNGCGDSYTEKITAVGHNYQAEIINPASCTSNGTKGKVCKNCQDIIEESKETIPAYGHTWGEWTETSAASCSSAGSRERKCYTCLMSDSEEIPAFGHSYGSVTYSGDDKNNEKHIASRKCSVCNDVSSWTENCTSNGKTFDRCIHCNERMWI